MDEIALPAAVEPNEWFVVFHPKSTIRWLSWLACGRFKHVSAFAYCPGFKAWLIYDVQWGGLRLMLVAHEQAKPLIAAYTADCEIVKIARAPQPMGIASRFGFYCVPAVKHLIGLRCVALRPDALYRHIIRNGGVPIDGQQRANAANSG